jgi:uncharacterized repeat protein (TIGR01451 family)
LAGSIERNYYNPVSNTSIEITNSNDYANLSVSVPVDNISNNMHNIPEVQTENYNSSSYNSSNLTSDPKSSSCSFGSARDSTSSSMQGSESKTGYVIKNIVIDVAGRVMPTSILAAGDIINYQINVTNNVNCNLTNVKLTNSLVTSMKLKESINEDGVMESKETWTYTVIYIVSQNDMDTNGNDTGEIENRATVDCDQFGPISSTVSVPIIVSTSLTLNEIVTDVGGRGSDNVEKPWDLITYKTIVTNTGNVKLTNLIVTGSPELIATKDASTFLEALDPGESWALIGTYNVNLDDIINNNDSEIKNAISVTCNEASPQSCSVTTHIAYKYTTTQPISSPGKCKYSNTSDPGEPSHYVGADGHKITLINNESAVNPTYKQLIEFIKKDKTNEIPYNNTSFVCSDAAERVHNDAETAGFRCAWVSIDFINQCATINPVTKAIVVGHACNLFNTTDKGLIGIDCTSGSYPTYIDAGISLSMWDNEVSLVTGEEYTPILLYSFPGSDKLKQFTPMGKIADIYIFW